MTTVAWTLLHFVWQGALVAGCLALLLSLAGKRNPAVRYALSVGALTLLVAFPLATAWRLSTDRTDTSSPVEGNRWRAASAVVPQAPNEGVLPGGQRTRASATEASVSGRELSLVRVQEMGDALAPYLVGLWLAGVAVLSLRVLGGWFVVRRLVTVGVVPASARIQQLAASLGRRMRLSSAVRVMESARLQVPAVVGWLKPTLLVPLSFESTIPLPELELILAHELAHIRRHDYLVNLAQTVVETLLFYHPAAWWISRQVREEREHCCDEIAVSVAGNRRMYAEALLRLEQLRQPVPLLAAAATGGSLLRRIRRLLADEQVHAEQRPRWAVVPMLLAVCTAVAGGLNLGGQSANAAIVPSVEGSNEASASGIVAAQQPRSRRAAPDTLVRHGEGGTVGTRYEWALARARVERRAGFWVGYSIAYDPSRGLHYLDRHLPVVSGGSVFSGRMRFGPRGSADGLTFAGLKLDSLLGPRSPEEQVLFVGYTRTSNGGHELDRVHLASGVLPMHFAGRTLYWLGDADDAESIALVRELFGRVRNVDLKRDLVAVAASHMDEGAALGALRGWLASGEPEELRADVAEELAEIGSITSLALMARTARSDRSMRVRAEAAEGLGEHRRAEAADTLVAVLADLDAGEVRREAIEALGEREEDAAFRALVRLAWDEPNTEMQGEAIESIGEGRHRDRVAELGRLLRDHPRARARAESAETLGETESPVEAVRLLRVAAEEDRDGSVRHEAIEALGEVGTREAMEFLTGLARTHRDLETRKQALEALRDHGDPATVLSLLEETLSGSADGDVQAHAAEALGDMDDVRAVQLLERVATTHAQSSVRKVSVEALGSAAPEQEAWLALGRIIRSSGSEEIQRAAVEAIGSVDHPDAARVLGGIARDHPSQGVRRAAIETLGGVETDEGRSILERLAREAGDEGLQVTAIESYAGMVSDKAAATLLTQLARTAASERVQRSALEQLADLDDGAGVPGLVELARSHPNMSMRRRAIEALGDADDPRAEAELRRLLRERE